MDLPKPRTAFEAGLQQLVKGEERPVLIENAPLQRRFDLDLRPCFDFSQPGQYTISAEVRVVDAKPYKETLVPTGNAVIEIAYATSSGTNTPPVKPEK
jgi:hypothetical protein